MEEIYSKMTAMQDDNEEKNEEDIFEKNNMAIKFQMMAMRQNNQPTNFGHNMGQNMNAGLRMMSGNNNAMQMNMNAMQNRFNQAPAMMNRNAGMM